MYQLKIRHIFGSTQPLLMCPYKGVGKIKNCSETCVPLFIVVMYSYEVTTKSITFVFFVMLLSTVTRCITHADLAFAIVSLSPGLVHMDSK